MSGGAFRPAEDRTCPERGCGHPSRFRVQVSTEPGLDGADSWTSGSCGTHLVDTIQRLTSRAHERRREPAHVTVYATAEAHPSGGDGPDARIDELALGTFSVPG
ncbi:hypothetical protein [Actinomadura gamaensis]|uniref:Uncharacterized protein n=1 Tax=Actinomadura gamaensis TaxID=1763541 RepID=A0ABV9U5R8_9ACTN